MIRDVGRRNEVLVCMCTIELSLLSYMYFYFHHQFPSEIHRQANHKLQAQYSWSTVCKLSQLFKKAYKFVACEFGDY